MRYGDAIVLVRIVFEQFHYVYTPKGRNEMLRYLRNISPSPTLNTLNILRVSLIMQAVNLRHRDRILPLQPRYSKCQLFASMLVSQIL